MVVVLPYISRFSHLFLEKFGMGWIIMDITYIICFVFVFKKVYSRRPTTEFYNFTMFFSITNSYSDSFVILFHPIIISQVSFKTSVFSF